MHLPSHFINTKWGPFCGWCLWSFVGRKKHFNVRCKAFCQKITVHCISKEEKVGIPIYVNGRFEYNTGFLVLKQERFQTMTCIAQGLNPFLKMS